MKAAVSALEHSHENNLCVEQPFVRGGRRGFSLLLLLVFCPALKEEDTGGGRQLWKIEENPAREENVI